MYCKVLIMPKKLKDVYNFVAVYIEAINDHNYITKHNLENILRHLQRTKGYINDPALV